MYIVPFCPHNQPRKWDCLEDGCADEEMETLRGKCSDSKFHHLRAQRSKSQGGDRRGEGEHGPAALRLVPLWTLGFRVELLLTLPGPGWARMEVGAEQRQGQTF